MSNTHRCTSRMSPVFTEGTFRERRRGEGGHGQNSQTRISSEVTNIVRGSMFQLRKMTSKAFVRATTRPTLEHPIITNSLNRNILLVAKLTILPDTSAYFLGSSTVTLSGFFFCPKNRNLLPYLGMKEKYEKNKNGDAMISAEKDSPSKRRK